MTKIANDADSIAASAENPTLTSQRILVLLAHPVPNQSEIIVSLAHAVRDLPFVTLVDLYAEYPTLDIEISQEQQRLLEHDIIVFLHPLYWYSTPHILKEWQDLVLEYNFAYGKEGTALKNKVLFSAVSAGGKESAYHCSGYNRYTLRELLRPLEMTANLCQMRYLPPFALYGARTAVEDQRLEPHKAKFIRLLSQLNQSHIDLNAASQCDSLNQVIEDEQ